MEPPIETLPSPRRRVRGRRRVGFGLAVGALVTVLVGCGGGGSDADPSRSPGTATTTTEAAATPATDFSAPGVAVIAHRGASGYAPEHTFAAYDLAVEQGADYLEQDLQLTADGQLVVVHDPTLDRTARGPSASCSGPIADKDVKDIQACDAGSWFNEAHPDLADPTFSELRIPTLAQVFDRYLDDVRYYIEIKAPDDQPGMVDALLDLLDRAKPGKVDGDLPPVVIQSFSAPSLQAIHARRPDLPLVQLVAAGGPALDGAALDDIAAYAVAIGPRAEVVDEALVSAAHERCLDVHPYTVDDPVEMARLLDAGAGAMFTNTPDVLVEARDKAEAGPRPCPSPATGG